jgi:hypothetical protein
LRAFRRFRLNSPTNSPRSKTERERVTATTTDSPSQLWQFRSFRLTVLCDPARSWGYEIGFCCCVRTLRPSSELETIGSGVVGVLAALKRSESAFERDEIAFLEQVARQVALASGPLDTFYTKDGGPLGIWRQWAPRVKGEAMKGGHFFPEENPDDTAILGKQFLSIQISDRGGQDNISRLDLASVNERVRSMAQRRQTKKRLGNFSDGIFSVIITILVLRLKPPEHPRLAAHLSLWPTALSSLLSYYVIAVVWLNHHYPMKFSSPPLICLNFMNPFRMSLVPFSTAGVGDTKLASRGRCYPQRSISPEGRRKVVR